MFETAHIPISMDFAKAIRIARSIAGVSQAELARLADIDASLVSLIESGKRQPSTGTLTQISTGLQMPVHLLTMLGTEAADLRNISPAEFRRFSESIARTVLQNDAATRESARRRKRSKPARPSVA